MINTKPVYALLETLTMGKGLPKTVNGVQLKLPAKYIRYFPGNYEEDNFLFMKSCCGKGATILDIGAHIGLFSAVAAKVTGEQGRVYAFEPAPATLPVLEQTIRINGLGSRICAVNQAMGSQTGSITFYVSDDEADNSNSLVAYKEDRKLNGVQVQMNTIDHFAADMRLDKIDFIKIDVEGAEYDTLRGGKEIFKNHRPCCILAIHPEPIEKKGDRLEDIYDLLVELNYEITYHGMPVDKEGFCSNRALIDLHLMPR
jgi:FkbM family methyltransferase